MLEDSAKFELISYIYKTVYYNASSLYADNLGIDLAYITAAIIENQRCELHTDSALLSLLRSEFEPTSVLWTFIYVEPSVLCVMCSTDKPIHDCQYVAVVDGWMCTSCRF